MQQDSLKDKKVLTACLVVRIDKCDCGFQVMFSIKLHLDVGDIIYRLPDTRLWCLLEVFFAFRVTVFTEHHCVLGV